MLVKFLLRMRYGLGSIREVFYVFVFEFEVVGLVELILIRLVI